VVERVGVAGESVTFSNESHDQVLACDETAHPTRDKRWCGGSAGQLQGGHLRDPRLDISCVTRGGSGAGFIWVSPERATRYVVADQGGYAEIYEAAGCLPVRIASTTGIDVSTSSASIRVSEYDATGRLVRRYRVDARVAG
jgi:hypothetical protein